MRSAWLERDAKAAIDHFAQAGIDAALALRIYSTRLLGREPKLVLHGGGNTSLKTTARDLLGEDVAVLCVKGSGWDMAAIEPAGMPAGSIAAMSQPEPLTHSTATSSPKRSRAVVFSEVLPPPCSTSLGSRPSRRVE